MLYSENLKFRALQTEDLKHLNEWRNNLQNKILAQGYRLPVTLIQDDEWIRKKMSNFHGDELFFIVEKINGKVPIGIIQLINIDYISGTATWGFIIGDKSNRGKGLSVEAAHLLFDYAFNILNLRKLTGYTLDYNQVTFKMLDKIGIVYKEGHLKKHYYLNGEYYDVIITSVFRDDYPNLFPKKNDQLQQTLSH
jgi:RimJ/RimL family protein N-acetyltransferase